MTQTDQLKSGCWWFNTNLCNYIDPNHCNQKDTKGNAIPCPRKKELKINKGEL